MREYLQPGAPKAPTPADEFKRDAQVSRHWSLGNIFNKMDWQF